MEALHMEVEPRSDSFWLGEWYVVMGETIGKWPSGWKLEW